MKQLLLICAVVALVGCSPTVEIAEPIVEQAIRYELDKPKGELTKADLEKVTELNLYGNQLTDVKGLEKLTWLKELGLDGNPDLTKAQIDELQNELPKCTILSNPNEVTALTPPHQTP